MPEVGSISIPRSRGRCARALASDWFHNVWQVGISAQDGSRITGWPVVDASMSFQSFMEGDAVNFWMEEEMMKEAEDSAAGTPKLDRKMMLHWSREQ